jgi:hypothetical protein
MRAQSLWLWMVMTAPMAAAGTAPQTCHLGTLPVPGFEVRSLDTPRFRALHAAVAPRGDTERWAEIPWETDLLVARQRAAREGKPLLMWIMDGHPLGCT